LKERPQYAPVESGHRRLHELAAEVLSELTDRASVSAATFDRFVEHSVRLRVDLDSLRNDMVVALRSRDSVTGTYRRLEVLPALREARELVQRGVQSACIAFMDLDHFKHVNDTHGHGVGDSVLARTAMCLMRGLRGGDIFGRFGGEEFLAIVDTGSEATLADVAQRLRTMVAREMPCGISVTASFGAAAASRFASLAALLASADRALYTAKAHGRNQCVMATDAASQDAAATVTALAPAARVETR
jgi:diguanylate cyclase (GGDEF)-like protein